MKASRMTLFGRQVLVMVFHYFGLYGKKKSLHSFWVRQVGDAVAGYHWHHFGTQVWRNPNFIKEWGVWHPGTNLYLRCCLRLVLGSTRMASTKWDLPSWDTICRAKYHRRNKLALHLYYCSSLFDNSMPLPVRYLPLLCRVGGDHDAVHLLLPTWNKECSHWGDDLCLEATLVLEARYSSWRRTPNKRWETKAVGIT